MKKAGRWVLTLLLLTLTLVSAAPASGQEAAWDCPDCGRVGNTGNFCGQCGREKPGMAHPFSQVTEQDIGTVVPFGRYEQDNIEKNGPEEITWIILDVRDGYMLLIAEAGLDAIPYHTGALPVTWPESTLHAWLNEDFCQAAFIEEERLLLARTAVDNGSGQTLIGSSSGTGDLTEDRVFLLSDREALEDYVGILLQHPCRPTEYSRARGAFTSNGFFGWKTRTPWNRDGGGLLEIQEYNGEIYHVVNESCKNASGAIRPAIWVALPQSSD